MYSLINLVTDFHGLMALSNVRECYAGCTAKEECLIIDESSTISELSRLYASWTSSLSSSSSSSSSYVFLTSIKCSTFTLDLCCLSTKALLDGWSDKVAVLLKRAFLLITIFWVWIPQNISFSTRYISKKHEFNSSTLLFSCSKSNNSNRF